MKLYQVVAKDILRRKRRVSYAVLGVVIGTMTVISILTISLAGETKIYDQLEKYGANLLVIPAISNVDMEFGGLSLGALTVGENYITEDKVFQVRQIADDLIREAQEIEYDGNIATVSPKLYINTELKGVSVVAVGIDPVEENMIKTWWQIQEGEYLEHTDQAMVGSSIADLLELNTGNKISLNGVDLTITGILEETGSIDDYQVFVPLNTLQKAFGKEGEVSSIDVRALCNGCPVETIADAINKNIPGLRAVAVKQVAATEMGMVEKINKFMLALAGITLTVGLFGVVNTMMTSVHERIKDFGIMRAVGASRSQIIKVLIYEATFIGLAGGLLGYGAGTLLAYAIGPLLFEGASIQYVPLYFPLSLALAVLVAIIGTLYPALRATKISVADSFRSL
jgi:putative ABC transport system permease protein